MYVISSDTRIKFIKILHLPNMKLKIPSLSIEMVVPRSRVVRSCSHDVYKMQVFVNE